MRLCKKIYFYLVAITSSPILLITSLLSILLAISVDEWLEINARVFFGIYPEEWFNEIFYEI